MLSCLPHIMKILPLLWISFIIFGYPKFEEALEIDEKLDILGYFRLFLGKIDELLKMLAIYQLHIPHKGKIK